ncbi:terminase small subunit [Larkinella sp. C7]|uniref:terminase small subunit n=1 Tax=Larkinella sp. C7 TaxID=2576607 RepID=UPI001110FE28|nr:terminase small subunit [Larkinella sp. C7]
MPAEGNSPSLSSEEALSKLNPRQRKFVIAYCHCFNATEAARISGYSEKTAYSIGSENLRKPEIKKAIEALCEELSMSAGEAFKQLTDIAKTRLQDYMVIRQVERVPRVKKPLQVLIDEVQATIDLEEEYVQVAELDKDEQDRHEASQKDRRNTIIRYQLELARNPDAFRIVAGEPQLVDEARVDLVALQKAKGEGRIKSLSFTEFGPKVELESSFSAIDKILHIHGRYVTKMVLDPGKGADLKAWTKDDVGQFLAMLQEGRTGDH